MAKKNIIKEKSLEFALLIVSCCKRLQLEKEYVMSEQLLRSGTAVGAMVREADHAESKADFIHKISIALKEANEAEYWIDLLHQSGHLKEDDYLSLADNIGPILGLLITILKSAKRNN